jgi:atypical dual specificity phosphatase
MCGGSGKLSRVRRPTAAELAELAAVGVGAVVSVLDDPSNLEVYERSGIPYLWLPIKGGTVPSPEQIHDMHAFIEQQNHLGCGFAIHGTNGKRRTGTMLAAYLIQSGCSYDDAVPTLAIARVGIAPTFGT